MNALIVTPSAVIEGQVLQPAVLDAQTMAYMNFARIEHRKLEQLIRESIIPMLGGYQSDLAKDLERHLMQCRQFSLNFCWQHRHLGASHGVVGEGDDV
ncbi:hypothetical protein DM819_21580 [Pseudomonas hunanensis]|uniref:Uncharacterized protein n=1 Tax=Pseudomonas hunanensis TaxID=1247546 RepID=A0ABD6N4M1_9PSED|nr:hypothetical protein [Pseudomonas hunanensis]NWL48384.1 hypothetical protein [Pseudomonas hunanensis]